MAELVRFDSLKIGDFFHAVSRLDGKLNQNIVYRVKQAGGKDANGKRCGIGNAFNETFNESSLLRPDELVQVIR